MSGTQSHLPTGNTGNHIGQRHVKVAAPPGGSTSWSLGWGAETVEQPVRRTGRGAGAFQPGSGSAPSHYEAPSAPVLAPMMAPSSDPYGSAPSHASYSSYSEPVVQKVASGMAVSSNAFARGANQNAGNVLTDRPTSKVLAPPGGRSSIVFG
jgi:protein SPIRAL1 and related proteins